MIRKPIQIDLTDYPEKLHPYLKNAPLYDSSCSPQARVIFIEKDQGYFLKKAPLASLNREYQLTCYLNQKGLATNVIDYITDGHDWLLTEQLQGCDCVDSRYLADPKRLCDILARQLFLLHNTDFSDCPVPNHTQQYLQTAHHHYQTGHYDMALFAGHWAYASPEDAYETVKAKGHLLETSTLLHGDYCLPNIILDNWKFSGFIDLDCGGVGDRHVDLFWAMWTLHFNLKTDRYRQRFMDAYGREQIDEERLRLIAAVEVFG